jgi:hypothetical protein
MATTVTLKPNAIDLSGSTSGTTTLQASAVAGTTTVTLPAATDTLVGKATTDTLTNKTLTAPVISTISNTGVLTLPTSTDTLVGRATTDTLTNKTLTSPVIDGTPTGVGVLTSGTAVASTSGTSIDFTSIPSWVKRITVMLNNVSTSGTSNWQVQIGDSGGVEITGYSSAVSRMGGAGSSNTTSTAGWLINNSGTAAGTFLGVVQIALLNSATNAWSCFGTLNSADTANSGALFNGVKATSATLDRVRITTANGTDTFDAGSINILFE